MLELSVVQEEDGAEQNFGQREQDDGDEGDVQFVGQNENLDDEENDDECK